MTCVKLVLLNLCIRITREPVEMWLLTLLQSDLVWSEVAIHSKHQVITILGIILRSGRRLRGSYSYRLSENFFDNTGWEILGVESMVRKPKLLLMLRSEEFQLLNVRGPECLGFWEELHGKSGLLNVTCNSIFYNSVKKEKSRLRQLFLLIIASFQGFLSTSDVWSKQVRLKQGLITLAEW